MSKKLYTKAETMLKEGLFFHLEGNGLRRALPKLLEEVVMDEHIVESDKEHIIFLTDLVIAFMFSSTIPNFNDDEDEQEGED